jgi:hypothetical protein
MLRPEALQRLLSDGLTGLPSAPPAWSAQTSSTMQQEVCARSLSDRPHCTLYSTRFSAAHESAM